MEYNPSYSQRQIQQIPSQNPTNKPNYTPYNPQFYPPQPSINHNHNQQSHLVHQQPYNYGVLSEYEQKLKDDVFYLHSLWYKGPPRISNPQPNPYLKPLISTSFKKKKKKPKKTLQSQFISDKEWPVETKPTCPSGSGSGSGWGEFKPSLVPITRPATSQEHAKVLALKIQLKGLDSCIGLFKKSEDDSSDDEDDDDEEDEDEYSDDCDEEFEFLLKVFEGDDQLRGFYEKNCGDGEFYCLVCGVIMNKLWRSYKNCVALVQHSISISKTKKKKAHRAYGYVICKVLGWDINQLPSLPLEKPNEPQGEGNTNVDGSFDNPNGVKGEANSGSAGDSKEDPKDVSKAVNKENGNSTNVECSA